MKRFYSLLLGICAIHAAHAQISIHTDSTGRISTQAKYINITTGIGLSRFRDHATSPLFYQGMSTSTEVSRLSMSNRKEIETGLSHLRGAFLVNYNDHTAQSKVQTISLYHSRLYALKRFDTRRWKFKAGGMASTSVNIRVNPSFMNNAVGLEIIPTLFGSFKVASSLMVDAVGRLARILPQEVQGNTEYRSDLGIIGPVLHIIRNEGDIGSHTDAITGHHGAEGTDHLDQARRQANLLLRLTQGGVDQIGIFRVAPPSGEGHFATMCGQAARPQGEYQLGLFAARDRHQDCSLGETAVDLQ